MSCILVMAGGTGGHVMPALAAARCLQENGVEIVWIGTSDGLEAKLVPEAGFELRTIHIKGLRQSGIIRLLVMPFMLVWAMLQAAWVIFRCKPDGVLGMGGFVSGPGGLVAGLIRRPLILHEQNAVAGLTNRYLSWFAERVLTGFPVAEGIRELTWVGNPVRQEIIDIPAPEERLRGREGPMRLLVIGGSRGASVFNQHLPELLGRKRYLTLEVWHQCGQTGAGNIGERYLASGISCEVNGFIDDMARAYAWCDIIVCRAGAMTVSEVCAAGVVAIFVPYPHAVSDHQTSNAAYLYSQSAAHLVQQEEFVLGGWLEYLSEFQNDRLRLVKMAQAARRLARPDAAREVARVCLEAIVA
jgi:UDP-N-acetylglucosamine--N-acetylmuramyl-(pentapeptide) pyrophosphoryl-undecaprenol N-acetylglucosamine transferase